MVHESLKQTMQTEPWGFVFTQLVRMLYLSENESGETSQLNRRLVGYENSPTEELVRFKASPRLRHSASDVIRIEENDNGQHTVEVSFIGLIGASGVMPHHYSQTVIDRLKASDTAMQDFFDLFHHRIISNFFRASVKYQLPFQHELFSRFRPDIGDRPDKSLLQKDAISQSIACTVGLGERTVQSRLDIDDRNLVYFAGHFSDRRPTLLGLKRMVEEFSGLAVKIKQFQFEWLYLDVEDQTNLSKPNKRLGDNLVIGNRVGSVQNRFRMRLGPLKWEQFLRLLPNQTKLQKLAQFTRAYVGIGLDFDFQLVLEGSEVPCMQLGNESCGKLGWNTWIVTRPPDNDVDDAVFDVATIKDGFYSNHPNQFMAQNGSQRDANGAPNPLSNSE